LPWHPMFCRCALIIHSMMVGVIAGLGPGRAGWCHRLQRW
jgi:hypothetical protein